MKDHDTWASVTRFDAGRVKEGHEYAVMLRLYFQEPTPSGSPPGPECSTPTLYLTRTRALDLIRLVGHALGYPDTGIEPLKPPTH